MEEKKLSSSKQLFIRLTSILFILSIAVTYYSSIYMRDAALNNLAEDDAKKTAELAFEVLYTKMQEGWSREDLYNTIDRLNHLKPGLRIQTYRSTLVEELYGKIEQEKNKDNDPLIKRALAGETIFITTDEEKIRYLKPLITKQECITCHHNSNVGDVNGILDMTFPHDEIKIPLDSIIVYFIIFTVIAIVITFFIFQFLMTRVFLSPISSFVNSISDVQKSENYSKGVNCAPQTYEIYILEKTFNELLIQVSETLEELKLKNKLMLEYKKAIDKSTIVSKADPNGIITYVNDAFCKISGYQEHELIGQSHNIVRSPHVPTEVFENLWKTIKAKETWRGVLENRRKNGESYFVQSTIIPILDDNDNIVEYVGARQDITELKKFQLQELSRSVDKALKVHLQDIIDLMPVSSLIVDRESKILYTNDIFNTKFSYFENENKILDDMFVEKEGYIPVNTMINWKDEVIMFQDSCTQKVLVNVFEGETEFYVYVNMVNDKNQYLIILFDIENSIFG